MTGLSEILGPRMVGPSSSHSAGACRLGYVVQTIVGGLAATPTGQRIAEQAGMGKLVELQRRGRTRGEDKRRFGPS